MIFAMIVHRIDTVLSQFGVLGQALEDLLERHALMDFFVIVQLPSEITRKKIAELIVAKLKYQKIIGGSTKFQELFAQSKVSLDNMEHFLKEHFGKKRTKAEIKL